MKEKIAKIREDINSFVLETTEQIEEYRIKYLSKKGIIPSLFGEFRTVAAEERKEMGMLLNNLKNEAQDVFNIKKENLGKGQQTDQSNLDLSLPVDFSNLGSRHPLSLVWNEIIDIFSRIGYTVSRATEIEDDFHNFTALNFPKDHPARDMQDTFFIEKDPDIALRTHTSSVQVRVMEKNDPPIRILSPGRVFRNEAISARAHCIFHQIEGLYIDENVSFADLRQTLLYFSREMFGEKTEIRLRPSYFPFTEPSAELDVSCNICGGKGCNVCKYTGWLEILGCGMVDPNVLENCNIDSKKYTGFAFGMGIERITMLKYQIKDIRVLFENDMRFLKQFESAT